MKAVGGEPTAFLFLVSAPLRSSAEWQRTMTKCLSRTSPSLALAS